MKKSVPDDTQKLIIGNSAACLHGVMVFKHTDKNASNNTIVSIGRRRAWDSCFIRFLEIFLQDTQMYNPF